MRHVKRVLAGGVRRLSHLTALALLALAAVPATAQVRATGGAAPGSLTIGLWTLSPFDRAEGGFSHCAISAPYSNGVNLIFSLTAEGSWHIGMAHQRWSLDVGQPLPLALEMHGVPPVAVLATAVTPWMVLSTALQDPGLVDRLREAARIVISGGPARFDLELRDLREAFAVLEGCAAERGPPGPASGPAPDVERIFAGLAAHPGLARMQRLSLREGGGLPNWDLVWRAGRLRGGLRVVTDERALAATDIASLITSDEARGCEGEFRSVIRPYDGVDRGVRFHAVCSASRGGFHSRYAVMPGAAGGYYLYAVSLLGREDALDELLTFDDLLAAAFRRIEPSRSGSSPHRADTPRVALEKPRE